MSLRFFTCSEYSGKGTQWLALHMISLSSSVSNCVQLYSLSWLDRGLDLGPVGEDPEGPGLACDLDFGPS